MEQKPRKSYTVEYKLRVVQVALDTCITHAAEVFHVCHSMVSRWVKNAEKLRVASPKSRKIGCGRTITYPDVEEQLHADVVEERKCGIPVTMSCLKEKMLSLVAESSEEPTSFKAS